MPKKRIIAANWKMNPSTSKEAEDIFNNIKNKIIRLKKVKTIIIPPDIFLGDLQAVYSGNKISLGAQDVFWEDEGSFTGEVSTNQLKDSDVGYVLVGHSERRALGDTNEIVKKKFIKVLESGLVPILCVGEKKRDEQGEYLSFITKEIKSALGDAPQKKLKNLIIAYEPIWAIGKDSASAMTPYDMHQMSLFIRKILFSLINKKIASKIPILYGGSAERENVKDLFEGGEIDGFLIGHASLNPEHFNDILTIIDNF